MGFVLFFSVVFALFVGVSFLVAVLAMSFVPMPFWIWAISIGCFITVIVAIAEFYNYGERRIGKTS